MKQTLKKTSVGHLPFPSLNFSASLHMRTFPLASLISLFSSFSNSRPFCLSKSPIYSSAQVERRPSPLLILLPSVPGGFFFPSEEAVFMKGSRILARQLDCGAMRAGISPRAGAHSPAWEDVRNDAPHGGQTFLCRRFQTYLSGVVSVGSEVEQKHASLLRPRGARQFVLVSGPVDACAAIQSFF